MTADRTDIVVSAIVSTCNAERFIRGCIDDLERQTIADRLEIIVIDSGSEQREGEVVRELQQVYGNIRYIRTERETVYGAWNRGIALARGRYVTNANTDDRHRADAFEIMARVLDNDPSVDLVYADVLITRTENETFERNTATGRYNWFPWDRNILLDRGCFIGPQPMWRRSLHDIYGYFDPACVTSGDYEFWLRISQTSKFHYIEEPLGLYLQHPESIEHRHEERKFAENREALDRYRKGADQRRLVRFLPFEELKELPESEDAPEMQRRIEKAIGKIDAVVAAVAPAEADSVLAYRQARDEFVKQMPASFPLVEKVIASAEKLILGSMEWCLNRPGVQPTPGEAELRATLMGQALAHGRALFQQGDVDGAVSVILNRGIMAAPLSLAPYLELVEILIAAGRFDDALQVFPEMPPGSAPEIINEFSAVCYIALGDDTAAGLAARSALEGGGARPRALVVLGTLAARQGRVDEAENFFRQAVQVDPACTSGWLSLGMLLWGGGKLTEAFDALCHAIDTGPANVGTVDIFLEMSRRLDRRHEATQLLEKIGNTHPDCRAVARATTMILAEQGRAEETLTVARNFLPRFGVDDDVVQAASAARRKIGAEDRLAAGGAESITLCMIVRNEEKNLPRCLASALPVVHEMVIVDTGSDDRTVAVAEAFGARVVRHAWNDDYAAARNVGLAAARGAWVLVLDADEALSALDYPLIRSAVRHGARTAWQVMTRNYTEDPIGQGWEANDGVYTEEAASGWYPSWKARLFPRCAEINFEGRVHEMVEPALRSAGFDIRRASFVVHHYGELDRTASLARKRRYYDLGKEKLADRPDDTVLLTELAVQAGELDMPAEALALWDRVLAKEPANMEALFNRGGILLLLERYAASRDDSRRAVSLQPALREARLNLALAQLHLGEVEQSRLEVSRLEPVSENYPPFWGLALVDAILAEDSLRAEKYRDLLKRHGFGIPVVIGNRAASLERAEQAGLTLRLRKWLGELHP